jgi:hypothetical protein
MSLSRETVLKRCSRALTGLAVSASFLLFSPRAHADAVAVSQISFGGPGSAFGVSINPDGGYAQFSPDAQASAFAESGGMTQTNFGSSPSIFASDPFSRGFASASVPPAYGMSVSVGSSNAVLGHVNGSDQAKGTIFIWDDNFMITGASHGTVDTEFKLDFSQILSVYTDDYGQSAQAETSLSLCLSGGGYNKTELLSSDWNLAVGPNQSQSADFSDIQADGSGFGTALKYNVPYKLLLEVDTETCVSNVPEPSVGALALVATLTGFLFWRKQKAVPPQP